jgi:hypothetical protein
MTWNDFGINRKRTLGKAYIQSFTTNRLAVGEMWEF